MHLYIGIVMTFALDTNARANPQGYAYFSVRAIRFLNVTE